jgi:NADH-quinone oxidoreductase subunit A
LQLLDYAPIVVLTLLALVVSGVIIALSHVAGRPRRSQTAVTPYECGVPALGNARERFSVKFYLIAVLFILFDIEIVFLYPWAVAFDRLGMLAIVEMFLFIALLLVGYVYVWKKGALEWD